MSKGSRTRLPRELNTEFGPYLSELIEKSGLTSKEVAERIGVSAAYISRIKSGLSHPPAYEKMVALAEILGVRLAEFMAKAGYRNLMIELQQADKDPGSLDPHGEQQEHDLSWLNRIIIEALSHQEGSQAQDLVAEKLTQSLLSKNIELLADTVREIADDFFQRLLEGTSSSSATPDEETDAGQASSESLDDPAE